MSQRVWKCEVCEQEFTVGKWTCMDGQANHVVSMLEYLLADAPSDPGHAANGGVDSLRDGRTRICNIPPDKQVVVNGEVRMVPGGYVEFIRGRYSTNDPEKQYYLDEYGKRAGGFVSEDHWSHAWLSQGQQLELGKMKLAAMQQRLENDRNELLSMTKERTKKQKEEVATP